MAVDPRLGGPENLKAVKDGDHYRIEQLARIIGGSGTSDFATLKGDGDNLLLFYARNSEATTDDPHILKAYLSIYGVSTYGGVAGMFVTRVDTPTASGQVGNAGGLDVWSTIGAAASSVSGLLYGVNATAGAEAAASAKSFTGTAFALFLASNWGTNVTCAGDNAAFIGLQDWGAGDKMPLFLDGSALTSGAGNAWDATHTTPSTCVGYLRVSIGGLGTKGIPVYTIA